jgi:hypothetical protein
MRTSTLLVPATLLASFVIALGACTMAPNDDVESARAEQGVVSNVHVLTSRNDNARTGWNPKEKILNTANVKAGTFGKIFSRPVDGQVYAQPLYVGGVNGKNVVYVATEHNSVYAFDADDTRPDAPPLWHRNFGPPVPSSDTRCGLLGPEVGITSTPVIDVQAKTIWFTTRNKENGQFLHKLHALDLATGEPRPNSPKIITAQARGTGDGSVNGVIEFDGLQQMQRPGLLKVGNRIFLAFASLCDIRPYHGWVLGYDATTLEQTHVHITTPNGSAGGIWNGGVGINADENGDVYYVSGDVYGNGRPGGTDDTFNGADNLGNSIVRLRVRERSFEVVTKFTPFDSRTVSPTDRSLGNGGGILIPGTNLFVAGDKRGVFFLVNRDDMGGTSAQDAQIVQKFQGNPANITTHGGTHGGGAFFKKGDGGIYYLWGIGDRLRAYKFNGERFELPALVNTNTLTGFPGGALSVSSDGDRSGTAILWAVRGKRTSPGLAASTGAGVLVAFDAEDITRQLWSSDDDPADMLGNATKFNPPTIANGRVFVGTSSNQLVVYGLKAGNPQVPVDPEQPATNADAGTGTDPTPSDAPTWTEIYNKYLGPGTPGHCSGTGGCHTNLRGGFKCGRDKETCYQGLVAAGLIDPNNPTQSPLAIEGESPLVWLGGGMPLDSAAPNPEAAAAIKAWVAAGAKND